MVSTSPNEGGGVGARELGVGGVLNNHVSLEIGITGRVLHKLEDIDRSDETDKERERER